jgi:hypothetical protein
MLLVLRILLFEFSGFVIDLIEMDLRHEVTVLEGYFVPLGCLVKGLANSFTIFITISNQELPNW